MQKHIYVYKYFNQDLLQSPEISTMSVHIPTGEIISLIDAKDPNQLYLQLTVTNVIHFTTSHCTGINCCYHG